MVWAHRVQFMFLCLVYRQWGTVILNNTGTAGTFNSCKFPIAFSNSNFSILAMHIGTDAVVVYEHLGDRNNTGCTLVARRYDGEHTIGWNTQWVAVGY